MAHSEDTYDVVTYKKDGDKLQPRKAVPFTVTSSTMPDVNFRTTARPAAQAVG